MPLWLPFHKAPVQSKHLLPCSTIHQVERMDAILVNSVHGQRNIPFSGASTMYGVISFQRVPAETEIWMNLAVWSNLSKSPHHGFHSFIFLFTERSLMFVLLIAVNFSGFSSSVKNLICIVHTGVTPYGPIPGGGECSHIKRTNVFVVSFRGWKKLLLEPWRVFILELGYWAEKKIIWHEIMCCLELVQVPKTLFILQKWIRQNHRNCLVLTHVQ